MLTKDLQQSHFIDLLGLENIPDKAQEKLFNSAVQVVETRVFNRILNSITDESDGEEFVSALEENDDARLDAFFKKHNISVDSVTREETLRLKEEMHAEFGQRSSSS